MAGVPIGWDSPVSVPFFLSHQSAAVTAARQGVSDLHTKHFHAPCACIHLLSTTKLEFCEISACSSRLAIVPPTGATVVPTKVANLAAGAAGEKTAKI
jgi:hypothetical protein